MGAAVALGTFCEKYWWVTRSDLKDDKSKILISMDDKTYLRKYIVTKMAQCDQKAISKQYSRVITNMVGDFYP
jgi:hypothetical protein